MLVILKHSMYRVKNGYAAHSPELGLTAHGYSAELARQNLASAGEMFLRPFERDGRLQEAVEALKLQTQEDETDIRVVTQS
jgi:hypothetical protein